MAIRQNISPSKLETYWMDWGFKPDPNNEAESIAKALASAANHYAVKFGKDPTRAKVHSSQHNDQLAAVAQELNIELVLITTAYNINHLLLSCQHKKSEDTCPPKTTPAKNRQERLI